MGIGNTYMEACAKCGLCIDVCPRYEDISLIDDLCDFLEGISEKPCSDIKRCLTCNLCTEECPEGLSIKNLITASRQKMTTMNGITAGQTTADPFSDNNLYRKFSEHRKTYTFKREGWNGEVLFFPGCAGTVIFPRMSKAMVNVLEQAGVDYTVMSGIDFCCGAVAAGTGNREPAIKKGVTIIEEARKRGVKTIVTTCPGCFMAFKVLYPQFIKNMDFEILQASQYLKKLIDEGSIKLETLESTVFYHDPCHLTRGMGIHQEPRDVLKSIPGTILMNTTTKGSACCGLGGGVRVNFPFDSIEMANRRHTYAKELGCDTLITNCAGCLQNLIEGSNGSDLKIFDLTEYVAESMGIKEKHSAQDDRETINLMNEVLCDCLPAYGERKRFFL